MATLMAWSITYLVHSTILILGAAVAGRFVRSASVRDVLWKIALTGGIITASLQTAIPEDVLPRIEQRETLSVSATTIDGVVAPRSIAAAPPAFTISGEGTARPAASMLDTARHLFPTMLVGAWLVAFILLATRLLVCAYRFKRIIAKREELREGIERRLLDQLRIATGCERAVRLTQSDAIESPIAMIPWEIVIPKSLFARLTEEQRRSILAHELAHLMRRDPLWLVISELVKAAFVFQPLNFFAQRAFKQTAEFICDDAAVHQTGDRRALVETLAELASGMTNATPSNVAAMGEGGSNLIVRVARVLRSSTPDRPMKLLSRAALLATAIVLTVVFAPGVTPALSAHGRVADANAARSTSAQHVRPAVSPARATQPPATPVVVAASAPPMMASMAALAPVAPLTPSTSVTVSPAASAARDDEDTPGYNVQFSEGQMSQTFDGPHGRTRVELLARDVELSSHPSTLRFRSSRGFVEAHEVSARGPRREIEVRPGSNGTLIRRYRENGKEKAWDRDADRVIHSAFVKGRAYDEEFATFDFRGGESSRRALSSWSGTHELTGTHDGEPVYILIKSTGMPFDADTGRVVFEGKTAVHVEEKRGGVTRLFTRNATDMMFKGDFEGVRPEDWLVQLITKHTSLPESVARAMTK